VAAVAASASRNVGTALSTTLSAAAHAHTAGRDELRRLKLALRFHIDLIDGLHASWMPPEWPQALRLPQRYGPGARAPLQRCLLRRWQLEMPPIEGSANALQALGWIDSRELRRLALLIGWSTHRALWRERALNARLHRCAARIGRDSGRFVVERAPALPHLAMNLAPLLRRPQGIGHAVAERGYRLLRAALADAGSTSRRRADLKLPRRVCQEPPPPLADAQRAELRELLLLCLLPERCASWDWLF
jgi:YOP proteins translocation protein K (YscK)